jgi:hypothetical protein
MSEQPVAFGPNASLIGVYTPAQGAGDTCCLLINAGVIHRIGPHRLNVKIARALAGASIATLRFDLSGRGDSRPASGSVSYDEQAVLDLRAAMDFIEREHGRRRFVIFGICSGAVNAFRVAVADPRVAGIFMVDGYWYRTRWTEPVRLWRRFRALSARSILLALRRRVKRTLRAPVPVAERAEIFRMDDDNNPPRAQFASDMNQLTARGVDTFFLFTNSVTDLVSYAGQLAHAFRGEPFVPRMRCEQRLDIDHTMVVQSAQAATVALVREWATSVAVRRA